MVHLCCQRCRGNLEGIELLQYMPEIIATEIGMTLLIIWIIHYCVVRRNTFSLRNVAISSFILTMMAGMFNALAYYLLYPSGFLGTVIAVNIAMLEMTVLIVILLLLDDKINGFTRNMALSFAFLFVFNEVSMAVFLYYLANFSELSAGILSPLAGIGFGMNNYLLIIPMAIEMVFLISMSIPKNYYKYILGAILAVSISNPLIIGNSVYLGYGLIVNFATMGFFMIFLAIITVNRGTIEKGTINSLFILLVLFVISSITLFYGVLSKNEPYAWIPFGIAGMLEMIFYFYLELSGHAMENEKAIRFVPEKIIVILSLVFISGLFSSLAIIGYFFPGYLMHL